MSAEPIKTSVEPLKAPAESMTHPAPQSEPEDNSIEHTMHKGLANEVSKKALSFPESAQLKGASNYEQWLQALKIVLRAYSLDGFLGSKLGFNMLNSQT